MERRLAFIEVSLHLISFVLLAVEKVYGGNMVMLE